MECCVCWNSLPSLLHTASFSTEGKCRSDHLLCKKCYEKCESCPLCRYQPSNKPLIYAEKKLDDLRERKFNLTNLKKHVDLHHEYVDIVNQMMEMKTFLNSISR